eukprot:6888354-Pyramimonas_sp.AAC.1
MDPEFLFHPEFEEDPWANELNFCSDAQLPSTLEPLGEPSGKTPQEPQRAGEKGIDPSRVVSNSE